MDQPADLNPYIVKSQSSNNTGYPLAASNAGQASILANANNVQIKDSVFTINTATKATLHDLYQRVAPNAILNEGGRADDAKCLPGTREEVIDLIEKWANDPNSNRILWLSGPAGGGKTAIMKTIVEHAAKRGNRTANFFFFRGDSTRQSIQPVVPTLLYQIFQYHRSFAKVVADIVSPRPRIFDESIAQQCKLISALFPFIRQSLPARIPIVLLVDGLDECDVDADRSQGDILRALEDLLTADNSPFRLLVASRPEARIKMAFNHLSLRAQSIFLDEEYRPEEDIRRFVVAEFDRIKAHHPSAHLLQSNWPGYSDIEGIVKKSSGQFIFAATVLRYIAHASIVPSLSLERVQGILPVVNNSPFMHLDSIYMLILSRADDLDAVLAMFSLAIAQKDSLMEWLYEYNSCYTLALVQSCVSGLSAIIKLDAGVLRFYHASFPDFLVDKARSGEFWIDVDAFIAKMLIEIWNKPSIGSSILSTLDTPGYSLQHSLLEKLDAPTTEIAYMLFRFPSPDWIKWRRGGLVAHKSPPGAPFFEEIQRLYFNKDRKTYCSIILQCIPQWAQFLANQVGLTGHDDFTLTFNRRKNYLTYLSTGGVTEWARTVGNSKVVQYSITSILGISVIPQSQSQDHPRTLYLCTKFAQRAPFKSSSTPRIQRVTSPLTRPNIRVGTSSATQPMGRAPPNASASGDAQKRKIPLSMRSLGKMKTLTSGSVRIESQGSRDHGDSDSENNNSDHNKGSIVSNSRTTTTKDSTSVNASPRWHSRVPPSRSASSASVNAREGSVTPRPGDRPVHAAPCLSSSHSRVTPSRSSASVNAREGNVTPRPGDRPVNAAPRLGSRSHSVVPLSRSASSSAREGSVTPTRRPGGRPVWRS